MKRVYRVDFGLSSSGGLRIRSTGYGASSSGGTWKRLTGDWGDLWTLVYVLYTSLAGLVQQEPSLCLSPYGA